MTGCKLDISPAAAAQRQTWQVCLKVCTVALRIMGIGRIGYFVDP